MSKVCELRGQERVRVCTWLTCVCHLFPLLEAFRRLISEALVQVSSSGLCVLDQVFLKDNEMWISKSMGLGRSAPCQWVCLYYIVFQLQDLGGTGLWWVRKYIHVPWYLSPLCCVNNPIPVSRIFMDVKYKPQLAVNLTKNYSELLRNFVADSHNHDVCVRITYMYILTKNTTLPNSLVHSTTFVLCGTTFWQLVVCMLLSLLYRLATWLCSYSLYHLW